MKIAIVEDESVHSRLLEQYLTAWGEQSERTVHILTYENAESFLFHLEDVIPDVVFADIQMPRMNGMDMIRKLREKNPELPVIFTSGLSDYLQEGYEVQALNYLIKPISEEKVFDCMERVCSRKNSRELYVAKTEDGVVRLDLQEVNYCEAEGHYTRFVLTDNSALKVMGSISELEKELSGKNFVKCHRSYLCNLENVKQIVPESAIFDNGTSIPVSRRLYQDFNRAFIAFYRGSEDR